jgi:ATP-dependent protease ClpP protease subunit
MSKKPKTSLNIEEAKDFTHVRFLNASDTSTIDMYLYGPIGADYQNGVDPERFAYELRWACQYAKKIRVHIVSEGGLVFDGWAIYSLIQDVNLNIKGVTVDTYCDGICASIAAIILLAGKKVYMKDFAKVMIHKASVNLPEDQMPEETKKMLAEINESTIQILTKRTNQTADDLLEMMKTDTYFNAQQAKEKGFVDEIIETPQRTPLLDASQKLENVEFLQMFFANNFPIPPNDVFPVQQVEIPIPANEPQPVNKIPNNNPSNTSMANSENEKFVQSLKISIIGDANSSNENLLQEIKKLQALSYKATAYEEEMNTLKAENQKLKEDKELQAVQQAEALVDGAIKDKKIRPSQKLHFFNMAKMDYSLAKQVIDEMSGHPNLAQKIEKEEDLSLKWNFAEFSKNNPEALKTMKESNPERYNQLLDAYYKDKK